MFSSRAIFKVAYFAHQLAIKVAVWGVGSANTNPIQLACYLIQAEDNFNKLKESWKVLGKVEFF